MMGLPDGPKSFRIGLVVLIQYRLWQTPIQPATQPPSHVAVAITLNALAKASSLKTVPIDKINVNREIRLAKINESTARTRSYPIIVIIIIIIIIIRLYSLWSRVSKYLLRTSCGRNSNSRPRERESGNEPHGHYTVTTTSCNHGWILLPKILLLICTTFPA